MVRGENKKCPGGRGTLLCALRDELVFHVVEDDCQSKGTDVGGGRPPFFVSKLTTNR